VTDIARKISDYLARTGSLYTHQYGLSDRISNVGPLRHLAAPTARITRNEIVRKRTYCRRQMRPGRTDIRPSLAQCPAPGTGGKPSSTNDRIWSIRANQDGSHGLHARPQIAELPTLVHVDAFVTDGKQGGWARTCQSIRPPTQCVWSLYIRYIRSDLVHTLQLNTDADTVRQMNKRDSQE